MDKWAETPWQPASRITLARLAILEFLTLSLHPLNGPFKAKASLVL
jgi:hypothetical protein